jgi:hypothetical protein
MVSKVKRLAPKVKRSKLEVRVGNVLELCGFKYEAAEVAYTIPATYTPDFIKGEVIVEVKGWFRAGDRQKYKNIAKSIQDDQKLFVFVLQDPDKKCSKSNKITMGQWCDKHNIPWWAEDDTARMCQELQEWGWIT